MSSIFRAIAPIVLKPSAKHSASVIFLHGRGDTGHGILEWLKYVGFSPLKHVQYIFPSAPMEPVTAADYEIMPSWFDVVAYTPKPVENENDIERSAGFIDELIADEEKLGIASNRIVIGGFSQGGAMSLFWGLTRPKQIGGIIALSSWVPCSHLFPANFKGNSSNYSFIGHGTDDPKISLTWANPTYDLFSRFLPNTTRKTYKGLDHQLSVKEIGDVNNFISSRLPELD